MSIKLQFWLLNLKRRQNVFRRFNTFILVLSRSFYSRLTTVHNSWCVMFCSVLQVFLVCMLTFLSILTFLTVNTLHRTLHTKMLLKNCMFDCIELRHTVDLEDIPFDYLQGTYFPNLFLPPVETFSLQFFLLTRTLESWFNLSGCHCGGLSEGLWRWWHKMIITVSSSAPGE